MKVLNEPGSRASFYVSGGLEPHEHSGGLGLFSTPQRNPHVGLLAGRLEKVIPKLSREQLAEGMRLSLPLIAALIDLVSAVMGLYAAF
jgi:hypothetical protein